MCQSLKGFGEGLGRVLGGIWEGLGKDLGRFWEIWALWVSWGYFGALFWVFACIFKHFMQLYMFWTSEAARWRVRTRVWRVRCGGTGCEGLGGYFLGFLHVFLSILCNFVCFGPVRLRVGGFEPYTYHGAVCRGRVWRVRVQEVWDWTSSTGFDGPGCGGTGCEG